MIITRSLITQVELLKQSFFLASNSDATAMIIFKEDTSGVILGIIMTVASKIRLKDGSLSDPMGHLHQQPPTPRLRIGAGL